MSDVVLDLSLKAKIRFHENQWVTIENEEGKVVLTKMEALKLLDRLQRKYQNDA